VSPVPHVTGLELAIRKIIRIVIACMVISAHATILATFLRMTVAVT
jgi:hypothetical protein